MRLGRARKVPGLGAVFDIDVPRRGHQRPDQRGTLAEMIIGGRGRKAQVHCPRQPSRTARPHAGGQAVSFPIVHVKICTLSACEACYGSYMGVFFTFLICVYWIACEGFGYAELG